MHAEFNQSKLIQDDKQARSSGCTVIQPRAAEEAEHGGLARQRQAKVARHDHRAIDGDEVLPRKSRRALVTQVRTGGYLHYWPMDRWSTSNVGLAS